MAAAGAEAAREGIYEIATDEGWVKSEWFKLHIRSKRATKADANITSKLPPLPSSKTVIQILSDFMRYLLKCAKAYIQDTHANGRDLWESVEKDIDYVISHPNGWEGYQQTQMCEAAVMAGLVSDSEKDKERRITFLTEGEASLHYAIRNGLPSGALENGEGVVIVDAGGGTVDVSAYRKQPDSGKDRFEEIAVPQSQLTIPSQYGPFTLYRFKQALIFAQHVIVVGGFASSDWLFNQIDKALRSRGLNVIRPENYVNKAVSDGAVSFYLRRQVRSRVSKFAYGPIFSMNYDSENPEHRVHLQRGSVYVSATGRKRIAGSFKVMIPKNTKIQEKKEYRLSSTYRFASISTLKKVRNDIWCYRGNNSDPKWRDEDPEMYSKLCQIFMDLSYLPYKTLPKLDDQGGVYYEIDYDYLLFYQGVELKAQMAWLENGVEKRSPARVVYDPTD
ncbi:hypothetical protein EST38_g183 [Candolleomyces aberdarensis]|uniref:Uncharacterized protein n=1 Tax=Candolleomyces aberdarensis TaxID=2316362 RepID=A0A4Q2DYQ1_9AGAR|nr:hypothetical protein EST38_g183 [Candolleomyces aberdarensis]